MISFALGLELATLAARGVSAQWQSQSGLRHYSPSAGLQHRSTRCRWAKSSRAELQPYWDVEEDVDDSQSEIPAIADFFFVVRGRSVFLGLRAKDPLRAGEYVPLIFNVGSKLPGAIAVAKQSSLFEQGLAAGRTIDIEITGPEVERLVQLGGQIFGQVMGMIPNVQAQPKPSLDLSSPEVHVEPRLLQAAEMQVSSSDLGFTVDALVDGAYVSDYFLEGKKIDLTLKGEDKSPSAPSSSVRSPLRRRWGNSIPLNALADVTLASGPEQINHRERVRAITISVSPPPEMALEEAMTTHPRADRPAAAGGKSTRRRLPHRAGRDRRQTPRDLAGTA